MRYLLTILCFIALQAQGQVLFHAHNRVSAPPPPAGKLLDTHNAAQAYSLRQLRSGYTGYAVNVRRSSDNATQDIGFDGDGDFDWASFSSFVGGGTGYVVTWYDQSGNGIHATQATTSAQPSIIQSVETGIPALSFSGGSKYLDFTTSSLAGDNLDIFIVLADYQYSTYGVMELSYADGAMWWQHGPGNGEWCYAGTCPSNGRPISGDVPGWVVNMYATGGAIYNYVSGDLSTQSGTPSTLPSGSLTLRMFRNGTASDWDYRGECYEYIIYESAHPSRTTNYDNQKAYYLIPY